MLKQLLAVGALVLLPVTAFAEPLVTSAGPRAGASITPDQLVVGGQLSTQGFAPDWSFDPSLELGFGDNQTVVAFNLDAYYHLRLAGSDWRPYVGGGLGVDFSSFDEPPGVHDRTSTDIGLNVVGGFIAPTTSGNRWFGELRFGVGDIPTLKLMFGINFRM